MKRIKSLIILSMVFVFLFSGYWYFENFTLKVTHCTITTDKINNSLKVVVLSDLHGNNFGKNNEILINKIKAENPDLIFILGDLYSSVKKEEAINTIMLVNQLKNTADIFYVNGEHDNDRSFSEQLEKIENVHIIKNKKFDIKIHNDLISVYGIDNVYYPPKLNLQDFLETPDRNRLNIILAHIPNYDLFNQFGADIAFSGDTHGGLVNLPYIGPLYFNGYFLPQITYAGKITTKGLYKFKSTQLFVTSGAGNYPLPLRFNNRTEICSIKIKGE